MKFRHIIFGIVLLELLALPVLAYAYYATGVETTIGAPLCRLMLAMNGTVGRSIAVVSVTMLGVAAMLDKMRWSIVAVAAGFVAVLAYAPTILDEIAGSTLGMGMPESVDTHLDSHNTLFSCGAAIGVGVAKNFTNQQDDLEVIGMLVALAGGAVTGLVAAAIPDGPDGTSECSNNPCSNPDCPGFCDLVNQCNQENATAYSMKCDSQSAEGNYRVNPGTGGTDCTNTPCEGDCRIGNESWCNSCEAANCFDPTCPGHKAYDCDQCATNKCYTDQCTNYDAGDCADCEEQGHCVNATCPNYDPVACTDMCGAVTCCEADACYHEECEGNPGQQACDCAADPCSNPECSGYLLCKCTADNCFSSQCGTVLADPNFDTTYALNCGPCTEDPCSNSACPGHSACISQCYTDGPCHSEYCPNLTDFVEQCECPNYNPPGCYSTECSAWDDCTCDPFGLECLGVDCAADPCASPACHATEEDYYVACECASDQCVRSYCPGFCDTANACWDEDTSLYQSTCCDGANECNPECPKRIAAHPDCAGACAVACVTGSYCDVFGAPPYCVCKPGCQFGCDEKGACLCDNQCNCGDPGPTGTFYPGTGEMSCTSGHCGESCNPAAYGEMVCEENGVCCSQECRFGCDLLGNCIEQTCSASCGNSCPQYATDGECCDETSGECYCNHDPIHMGGCGAAGCNPDGSCRNACLSYTCGACCLKADKVGDIDDWTCGTGTVSPLATGTCAPVTGGAGIYDDGGTCWTPGDEFSCWHSDCTGNKVLYDFEPNCCQGGGGLDACFNEECIHFNHWGEAADPEPNCKCERKNTGIPDDPATGIVEGLHATHDDPAIPYCECPESAFTIYGSILAAGSTENIPKHNSTFLTDVNANCICNARGAGSRACLCAQAYASDPVNAPYQEDCICAMYGEASPQCECIKDRCYQPDASTGPDYCILLGDVTAEMDTYGLFKDYEPCDDCQPAASGYATCQCVNSNYVDLDASGDARVRIYDWRGNTDSPPPLEYRVYPARARTNTSNIADYAPPSIRTQGSRAYTKDEQFSVDCDDLGVNLFESDFSNYSVNRSATFECQRNTGTGELEWERVAGGCELSQKCPAPDTVNVDYWDSNASGGYYSSGAVDVDLGGLRGATLNSEFIINCPNTTSNHNNYMWRKYEITYNSDTNPSSFFHGKFDRVDQYGFADNELNATTGDDSFMPKIQCGLNGNWIVLREGKCTYVDIRPCDRGCYDDDGSERWQPWLGNGGSNKCKRGVWTNRTFSNGPCDRMSWPYTYSSLPAGGMPNNDISMIALHEDTKSTCIVRVCENSNFGGRCAGFNITDAENPQDPFGKGQGSLTGVPADNICHISSTHVGVDLDPCAKHGFEEEVTSSIEVECW